MLIFLSVCILFSILIYLGRRDTTNKSVVFHLPKDALSEHQPSLTLYQREKQRRRLMNEVFVLGFYSREALEGKHRKELGLMQKPYKIE